MASTIPVQNPPRNNGATFTPSQADWEASKAEFERMKAENLRLKAALNAPAKLTLRVSKRGALSVYGFGRFPVTLYKSQWTSLINGIPAIVAFLEDNAALFSTGKDDPRYADVTDETDA